MPLDVEGWRASTAGLVRGAHALHAGVHRNGEAVGGCSFENWQIARVAIGALAAARQQHLDEAWVGSAALDLCNGGDRVLARHDDRAAEAVVGGKPDLAEPIVMCPSNGCRTVRVGHQADAEGIVGGQDADLGALVVEHLFGDGLRVATGDAGFVDRQVGAKPRRRVGPGVVGQAEGKARVAKPIALGRFDELEDLLHVGDLNMHVAINHRAHPLHPLDLAIEHLLTVQSGRFYWFRCSMSRTQRAWFCLAHSRSTLPVTMPRVAARVAGLIRAR